MTFAITCQWLSSLHEVPEVREAGARLKIELHSDILTRNIDEWSGTVSDEVRLSAYPLALWLTSNWWRLRWEPLQRAPNLSWRMSHEVAASGHGYLWPRLLIVSDGGTVQIGAKPVPNDKAPVHYLTTASGAVSADEFERTVDRFIEGVLARLDARKVSNTDLYKLYEELKEERANADLANFRRLEAIAGFDAGEGPDDVVGKLEALIPKAGTGAVQEIAALCASAQSGLVDDTERLAGTDGIKAKPDEKLLSCSDQSFRPWEKGRRTASSVRKLLGMDGTPISDDDLCDVMGVPKQALNTDSSGITHLGLAVRQDKQIVLHPRRRNKKGLRFEMARFLCDHITAAKTERWLPATDAHTLRQKVQRSFAAELLCPLEGLSARLGNDFSDDAIEEAADYFKVGELVVLNQLRNNHLLPPDLDSDDQNFFGIIGLLTA